MSEAISVIRDLAVHEAEIRHIQDDMDRMVAEMAQIKRSLAAIEATLAEAKGGWKTLMWVGGAGTTFGAFVGWIADHIGK